MVIEQLFIFKEWLWESWECKRSRRIKLRNIPPYWLSWSRKCDVISPVGDLYFLSFTQWDSLPFFWIKGTAFDWIANENNVNNASKNSPWSYELHQLLYCTCLPYRWKTDWRRRRASLRFTLLSFRVHTSWETTFLIQGKTWSSPVLCAHVRLLTGGFYNIDIE